MITTSGIQVWPRDGIERSVTDETKPTWNAPSLFDIGTGLSRTFRFAGQTRKPYTVLAHVLTCADLVPPEISVYALLHDAGESVVGDQVSTWKNPTTKLDESDIMERICEEHNLQWPFPADVQEVVTWADRATLRAEAYVLEHGEPNHPYFLSCPEVQEAYALTAQRADDCLSWIEYGVGGLGYEAKVEQALEILNAHA